MTYKAAAAGLPLGGGKAVIIGDPHSDKSEDLLESFGRAVDALGGTYITAEDVGTTVEDMVVVSRSTDHVTGLPVSLGGSGDPSPATAHGVLAAIRATSEHLWGTADLDGRKVAVQGVGKVGGTLAELLVKAGCEVVAADVDEGAIGKIAGDLGVVEVPVDEIVAIPCDILSPCALGASISESSLPRLHCKAIVGAANNQLAEPADADRLTEAGILYTPDFIANAGGIINIVEELKPQEYSWERAIVEVERIHDTTARVLDRSQREGITTRRAAVLLAEERLAAAQAER
jgi:leucine dehydrogenase